MEESKKFKIKIADTQFAHSPNSFGCGDLKSIKPAYFEWYRGSENINDIIVLTEDSRHKVNEFAEKIKILLIIEPPSVNPQVYEEMKNPAMQDKFSYILTFGKELLTLNPQKFISYLNTGCWIEPHERKVYCKTKNISIIASKKNFTPGHKLRHDIIAKHGNALDGIYGTGYKYIYSKLEGLKDYRFSIVVENDRNSITEKIIDCFATGTIPVYYGNPNIGSYFSAQGIVQFNSMDELDYILKLMGENFYRSSLPHVKENFELAKKYYVPEDELWLNFFSKLFDK